MEDNKMCGTMARNYDEEVMQLKKELEWHMEENRRLNDENEVLRSTIVEMAVARFLKDGR